MDIIAQIEAEQIASLGWDELSASVAACRACSLCEQRGTGEQAMRSVGGDYRRFLARLDRR